MQYNALLICIYAYICALYCIVYACYAHVCYTPIHGAWDRGLGGKHPFVETITPETEKDVAS